MKKFLLLCLLVSVGFNLYLVKYEYIVRDDFEDDYAPATEMVEAVDQVKLAQSAVAKKEILKPKKSCSCKQNTPKYAQSFDERDERAPNEKYSEDFIREQIEQKHREWLEESDKFFYEELRLSSEQIARYRELAKNRQKEIDIYFNKKHADLAEGETASYMFTSEDTIFMGKVTEAYEESLREAFGEENYKSHKDFINKHNSRLNSEEFVQYVEF